MLSKIDNTEQEKKRISIVETILLYICIVSVLNVILLSVHGFYSIISTIVGFLLLCLFLIISKRKITFRDKRFSMFFLFIIAIGLFFRATPNLYLTGGQDQGTYVSLSKQYEINHGLYIQDNLRKSLSQEAKTLYDKSGAATMLGVKVLDLEESVFYMPFYPVFPSWMSIFGSIFSSESRIYALTMFSILSIVAVYLFSYEISGRRKKVALLSSFLITINPLHVYFSRVPLTEIVSLCFFLFSFYFLIKFYNDYRDNREQLFTLFLSLFTASVLFLTRMSALLYLPLIILIPIVSILFSNDKRLTKYLSIYSITWVVLLFLSYVFYYIFLPDLFNSIFLGRILEVFDSNTILLLIISSFFLILISFRFKIVQNVFRRVFAFIHKYIFIFLIIIFAGLILYELFFYVKEIIIDNNYSLLSFESLSYLKQLNFLATFLYLSPIGLLLIPIASYCLIKKKDMGITFFIFLIVAFLIYCWGITRLSPYHYYFIRYQLSELIPLLIVLISMFLVSIYKKKYGKILVLSIVIITTVYFCYFSFIQLREYEGANPTTFRELQSTVQKDDLLLVAGNSFESSQQIVFPIKYYYGINTFSIYTSTYIDYEEIKELKGIYEDVYILTTNSGFEQQNIKLVKEVDFKHNYFVHCNRKDDRYFKMEGHTDDIPFCKYIVIPNRYYFGTYKMYLYLWE